MFFIFIFYATIYDYLLSKKMYNSTYKFIDNLVLTVHKNTYYIRKNFCFFLTLKTDSNQDTFTVLHY